MSCAFIQEAQILCKLFGSRNLAGIVGCSVVQLSNVAPKL